MNSCAFCGRENEAGSRFCIDCGKALDPAAARVAQAGSAPIVPPTRVVAPAAAARAVPYTPHASGGGALSVRCPHCGEAVDPALPFCAHCGGRRGGTPTPARGGAAACGGCGAPTAAGDVFCSRCGTRLAPGAGEANGGNTVPLAAARRPGDVWLALLDVAGTPRRLILLERAETLIGRVEGHLRFEDDPYLSPIHAQLAVREGTLWLRDLGSRNGSWAFLDAPARLADGDLLFIGSQLLRFRRLGFPGPHPGAPDGTRRLGSATPSADVAVLEQLRADGSVRDVLHLSPGRNATVGRETGDWTFPYDQTMSGRHAEIRSEDAEFVVHDLGSRNGVALAVRGERAITRGQRILIGEQILRLESV